MIKLPEGQTLEDVFKAIPKYKEDPDIRVMLEDIYLKGWSCYKAANRRYSAGVSHRTYNTLYYHAFNAQREVNQLYGKPAEELVDELITTGSLTVSPERVSEIDMVCRVLKVSASKQVMYSLER